MGNHKQWLIKAGRVAWMLSLCFLLSLCSPLKAQIKNEMTTKGWPNGNYWESLDGRSKISFLYGLESGVSIYAHLMRSVGTEKELSTVEPLRVALIIKGVKFIDISEEVESFYADESNIIIPIAYAYHYVSMKLKGARPEELETYAAALQKAWNE